MIRNFNKNIRSKKICENIREKSRDKLCGNIRNRTVSKNM